MRVKLERLRERRVAPRGHKWHLAGQHDPLDKKVQANRLLVLLAEPAHNVLGTGRAQVLRVFSMMAGAVSRVFDAVWKLQELS